MPKSPDLNKILFAAPTYSHFVDLRQAPETILNKKELTVRDVVTEAMPFFQTYARDYLFLQGKYTQYKEIIGFLTFVTDRLK